MTGPFALVAHDLRLQYRYGIYVAYAFVVGFYVLVLALGRGLLPAWGVGLVIYTDPAAVGFFFLGALMMLEKSENVRSALAISPASAVQYLLGKAVTLTSVGLVASIVVMLVHGAVSNPALLIVAVLLTSLAFLALGVPIALRFRTVNGYLVGSSGFLIPLIMPAGLALLEPMPIWLGLWPPVAQFRLILVAVGHASATPAELALLLAVAAAGAATITVWALAVLRRELGK